MKLKKLYDLMIEKGIEQDPRGKSLVEKELKKTKQQYEKLSDKEKTEFDIDRLKNPYGDTRILFGNGNEEIKTILIGIDIDVGEVILADRLKEKGKKIDMILSHHPEGRALAALYQVMYMQADIVHLAGVPINIAESLLQKRIDEVERRLLPVNHSKTADAARLLQIPLLCVHTPADNHVSRFLQHLMDKKKPDTVGEIVALLKEIPEYQQAVKNNSGPKIISGSSSSRAGKVFVDMTGGTEGSKDIFAKLAQAGVGTVVGMHLSEDHLKKAKEEHVNVVIAGHISSDNVGLNLILDAIEKQHRFDIIECSGFTRIKRK
ncbi:MAG: Nif3-like dinuclear metal center hexameric protein [Candidatus Omnitrophica bacterium]|nr:Nif3-like dinuclear metal center hexameric protein [Candidatus Omnitrophota bacterium]MBU4478538.1 Nif3-like dinuclear metal center hexameric protein [Candidatus Omnitrophota bacterium]